jgi:hypothetical protein
MTATRGERAAHGRLRSHRPVEHARHAKARSRSAAVTALVAVHLPDPVLQSRGAVPTVGEHFVQEGRGVLGA